MTSRTNPYVGPRAIEYGEKLYGRDREIRQLRALLVAERIVLMHSPSGAGKTSLIQAGLLPTLLDDDFGVLPVIRVGLELPENLNGQIANRYLISTLLSLEEGLTPDQRLPINELASLSLDDYLNQRPRPQALQNSLALVFDQFEEIITVDPNDRDGKLVFFDQLGAALRNRDRWALFAVREDYLGALSPYVRPIPNRMSSTFRLDLLGVEAALQAIKLPARRENVNFTDGAARRLVKDLSTVHVQRPDGTIDDQEGQYVEPVQLQVVCFRLWETQPETDLDITEEDLNRVGSVDLALADYYNISITRAVEASGVSERAIRDWFGQRLITPEGIRGQVLLSRKFVETTDNPDVAVYPGNQLLAEKQLDSFQTAVRSLVDAHIIRSNPRAGVIWFELAHDRLIEPVRRSNSSWYKTNLKLFQQQAALWSEQGRPAGLLLIGKELVQAEKDAQELDLIPEELAFLDESREAQAAAERETRRVRAITLLAVLASIALVVAAFFWAQAQNAAKTNAALADENARTAATAEAAKADALIQKSAAQTSEALAKERARLARGAELATQALAIQDNHFLVSLLLGIESYNHIDIYQTRSTLLDNARSHPQLEYYLNGHKNVVTAVAFNPDGKTVASAGWDGSVVIWDMNTHQPIGQPITGYNDMIKSIAFSPDGKYLAISGDNHAILLWDVASRNFIGSPLQMHNDRVVSVVFSPDSKILASGSWDTSIILWDVKTLRPIIQPLKGHAGSVSTLAFSPDGKIMASGGYDNAILLWDTTTWQPIGEPLKGHTDGIASVMFSPDGKTLASASFDKTIRLWNINSHQEIGQPLLGHEDGVASVAFSPSGNILASGSRDHTIRLWNLNLKQPTGRVLEGHTGAITSLSFSPDGKRLASGSYDNNVIVWDIDNSPNLVSEPLLGHTEGIRSLAFSPDGNTLASGSNDKTVLLWNLTNLQPSGDPLTGHSKVVTSVAFSPDGTILASGSGDTTITFWDTASKAQIGSPLIGHKSAVSSLAFSPDGKTLASGGFDNTVMLWDVLRQQPASHPLIGHTNPVSSVAFSRDGKMLASGSYDKTIILWNPVNGQSIGQPLTGHTGIINSIAFSPDRKILASGSADQTILLWDIENHKVLGGPLVSHTLAVTGVAFSPDGKILASASSDQTIILWDVVSRKPIGSQLTGHSEGITSLIFNPNGNILASGSYDNTILLWDLDPQSWIQKSCDRAGRNMTQTEWQQFFAGEEYHITCPEFPSGK